MPAVRIFAHARTAISSYIAGPGRLHSTTAAPMYIKEKLKTASGISTGFTTKFAVLGLESHFVRQPANLGR